MNVQQIMEDVQQMQHAQIIQEALLAHVKMDFLEMALPALVTYFISLQYNLFFKKKNKKSITKTNYQFIKIIMNAWIKEVVTIAHQMEFVQIQLEALLVLVKLGILEMVFLALVTAIYFTFVPFNSKQ